MRKVLALLVVAFCLSHSDATLRHIKAKLNKSPLLRGAVQYLAAPEPLPAVYARPAYAAHVSTYSVAVPHVPAPLAVPHHVPAPLAVPHHVPAPLAVPHHVPAPLAVPHHVPAPLAVPHHVPAPLAVPHHVPATLAVPHHVHETTYAAPPVVYPELLTVPAPHLHYHGPEAVIVEPVVGHVVEEHFGGHLPLNTPLGNW